MGLKAWGGLRCCGGLQGARHCCATAPSIPSPSLQRESQALCEHALVHMPLITDGRSFPGMWAVDGGFHQVAGGKALIQRRGMADAQHLNMEPEVVVLHLLYGAGQAVHKSSK